MCRRLEVKKSGFNRLTQSPEILKSLLQNLFLFAVKMWRCDAVTLKADFTSSTREH
jgi:hypothetical protein